MRCRAAGAPTRNEAPPLIQIEGRLCALSNITMCCAVSPMPTSAALSHKRISSMQRFSSLRGVRAGARRSKGDTADSLSGAAANRVPLASEHPTGASWQCRVPWYRASGTTPVSSAAWFSLISEYHANRRLPMVAGRGTRLMHPGVRRRIEKSRISWTFHPQHDARKDRHRRK